MLNPTVVWLFILANSSLVSLPALERIASGTPTLPMSWRRPPRSRRTHGPWSFGEYFICRAIISAYWVTRSECPRVYGSRASTVRASASSDNRMTSSRSLKRRALSIATAACAASSATRLRWSGVPHRDASLVAKRRKPPPVVGRPLALLGVENRKRAPQSRVFEHRHADGSLQPIRHEVRRRLEIGAGRDVRNSGRPAAEHDGADDALPVLKLD